MKTIGFVGTAKNTGKTTTALYVLELVKQAGIHVALTSIGYDGENLDHVTGLPKPRYFAEEGMVIATTELCLKFGTAEYRDIINTGLRTILGDIVIATLTKPGYVVLAGPNRRVDLKILLDKLASLGVELTMVDGALNRLAALTLADGMVLSTGAAYDERIPQLVTHAAATESLFHCSEFASPGYESIQNVVLCSKDGDVEQLTIGSILDESNMQMISKWFEKNKRGTCIIPGVFAPGLFQRMLKSLTPYLAGSRFVFYSPLNLLASGSPEIWETCFSDLAACQVEVSYLNPTKLHFMTVNPFYPKYLQKTGSYIAAFVDKHALLNEAQQLITKTPIMDILQPPQPDLLHLCGLSNNEMEE